ncbi:MAG: hypothetical protein AAF081_16505 [Actinomycetota bacterium]
MIDFLQLRRRRLLIVFVAAMVVAVGCSSSATTTDAASNASPSPDSSADSSASEPEPAAADTTADPGTDDAATEDAVADDATTTDETEPVEDVEEEPPPMPVSVSLTPDPVGSTDPRETVEHLTSVEVMPVEDGIAFIWPDLLPGAANRILLTDPTAQVEAYCGVWMDEEGNLDPFCGAWRLSDSFFFGEFDVPTVDSALGYGFVAPLTADDNYVSLTIDGVDFMAPELRVGQEPLFVQWDVNVNGLAEDVLRVVGFATPADIAAALG